MTWIAVSDMGIGMALSRSLIRINTSNQIVNIAHERNRLLSTSFFIFLSGSFIFLLLSLFFYPLSIKLFSIQNKNMFDYTLTYFITSAAGAVSLPLSIYGGVLESFQKIALNRNISTFTNVINILMSIILVFIFKNIVALALALLFSVLLRYVVSLFFANKLIETKISFNLYSRKYTKDLFSYGGYFQIGKIANTVATNTDNIFISTYIGAAIVPSYTFTSKLYQIFGIVIASKIPTTLFSGVSQLVDEKRFEKIDNIFQSIMRILFRIALFTASFAFFFNSTFVELWVGKSNYAGNNVNIILVYLILFETIFRGTSALIYAYGDLRNWAFVTILETILNITLSLLFVKSWGIVGLLVATAISRTLTSGVYIVIFFWKKRFLTIQLLHKILIILFKSIPTILVFFVFFIYTLINSWSQLLIVVLVGFVMNILIFDFSIISKNRNQKISIILLEIIKNT
ncbi:polysaccharide biosynthesis protein [mine drainage metagenome]|uniref:Polysaccharide biosynthesis protein n=1 Tax=mine drainage metagenome TaxID=410659 RepID=A0A1J5SZH1_9ZZZZ